MTFPSPRILRFLGSLISLRALSVVRKLLEEVGSFRLFETTSSRFLFKLCLIEIVVFDLYLHLPREIERSFRDRNVSNFLVLSRWAHKLPNVETPKQIDVELLLSKCDAFEALTIESIYQKAGITQTWRNLQAAQLDIETPNKYVENIFNLHFSGTSWPHDIIRNLYLLATKNLVIGGETTEKFTSHGLTSDEDSDVRVLYLPYQAAAFSNKEVNKITLEFVGKLAETLLASGLSLAPRLQMVTDISVKQESRIQYVFHSKTDADLDKVRHYKESPVFPRFYLSRFGYSGWGPLEDTSVVRLGRELPMASDDDFENAREYQAVGRGKYKEPAAPKKKLRLSQGRVMLVTLQTQFDTVLELHQVTTIEALRLASTWAQAHGWKMVVKRHPMCSSKNISSILRELGRLDHVIVANHQFEYLLSESSILLTGNSGTGLQALLNGVPVVTWGKSEYDQFVEHASTSSKIPLALTAASLKGVDKNAGFALAANLFSSQIVSPTDSHFSNKVMFFDDTP